MAVDNEVTLIVHNIPTQLSENAITNIFSVYGKTRATKRRDRDGRFYAFVRYSQQHEADNAIAMLHDKKPFCLSVKYARGSEPRAMEDFDPELATYVPDLNRTVELQRPPTPPLVKCWKRAAAGERW